MCCWEGWPEPALPAARGGADPFLCDRPPLPSLSQEEAAGGTAPAGQLLLPAVEDLQLELLFSLQVLCLPGRSDGSELCPGNTR